MGSELASIQDKDLRKLGRQAILAGWHATTLSNSHVRFQSPTNPDRYVVIPSTPSDHRTHANCLADFRREGGLEPLKRERKQDEAPQFEKIIRNTAPVTLAEVVEEEREDKLEKYRKGQARDRVRAFLLDRAGRNVDHETVVRATLLDTGRVSTAVTQLAKRDPRFVRRQKGVYSYLVPEVDPKQVDKGRRAAITAKVKRQARMAKAPKPGEARTIDEVLQRGTAQGEVAATRRKVLEKLLEVGGTFEEPKGGGVRALAELLGMDSAPLAGVTRKMIEQNQIGKEGNSKRTYKLFLLDPWLVDPSLAPPLEEPSNRRKEEPVPEESQGEVVEPTPIAADEVGDIIERFESVARHPSFAPAASIAVPTQGQTLTVLGVYTRFDGTVTIELKNGTKSWLAHIEAMRAFESA